MNLLKSLYVSTYITLAALVTGFAAYQLIVTGNVISWGGVLLVYTPFLAVLAWILMLRNTPRTSARFPILITLGVVGVLTSAWGYLSEGSATAPLLAAGGLVAFFIYDYWYSSFGGRNPGVLIVGQSLPDFELKNSAGDVVSSSTLMTGPTVWIFYRGNWCPLCMAQVKEIAAQYNELEALGVRVALISPQPHKFSIGLAKKFDVNFDFLTDEGNRAARQLGIAQSYGVPMGMQVFGYDSDTVMPTVIITDNNGYILWSDLTDNYRVRPEPDTYLRIIRTQCDVGQLTSASGRGADRAGQLPGV
jgi:peroxiredoxin